MSQCYSLTIDRCIIATGIGREVVDGLNAIDKRYIYQLISNVKLPGSKLFDSHMQMHTSTQNSDASIAKELQQHMSNENSQNCVIDQGKYKIIFSERKWTDRDYHVQDNANVAQKYLKMYLNTKQFSALPFCGPNYKPHGARGLSKHYNLRFDPKLGNFVCAIFRIPCDCVACTTMIDKPWISGIT